MDPDLTRDWHRWTAADAAGRDDEADAACRGVLAAAPPAVFPSRDFTMRTLAAIATARALEARRARRARRAAVAASAVIGAAALYLGGGWAATALSGLVIGTLNVFVAVAVRMAVSLQGGSGVWDVLGGLGRAAAAFVADPAVTAAMLGLQGIAIAALLALHRLLGSERETLR